MDPHANMAEQRRLANRILALDANETEDVELPIADAAVPLASLVLVLDEWRRKGGYDPYTTWTPATADVDWSTSEGESTP